MDFLGFILLGSLSLMTDELCKKIWVRMNFILTQIFLLAWVINEDGVEESFLIRQFRKL